MKKYSFIFGFVICTLLINNVIGQIPSDKWTYIQADSSRQMWGDWKDPEWLRYFGLDMKDINLDGYNDILAGRYVYLNPAGDMTGKWMRKDLGFNVDGMLLI